MLDKTIKVRRAWETPTFSAGGAITKNFHYEYTVAEFGPFIETFGAGDHNQSNVEKKLNERALMLRELGIIPASGG